ncbi:MAG: ABC transporter substrate-binding protein [Desulfuromonadaceae bacterium]|nr:ABC transporter substrate-binding protein [Desulfuromonadaceae bacterium]
MRRILGIFFLLTGWWLILPGTGFCILYTDALGRQVELPQPPQRIVSLVPAVTETLYALDAGSQLVGRTDFCNYPPQVVEKVSVGAYDQPNLEAIALLQPDLVIVSADTSSEIALERLEALQTPVYVVYPRSLSSLRRMYLQLGEMTGHAGRGERLARDQDEALEKARMLVDGKGGRGCSRVLLTVMVEPLVVVGNATLIGEILQWAGGENVVRGPQRYPVWNMEAVLQADPALIIVSPHPGTPDPEAVFLGWPQLSAVKQQRVVRIEADWLQRPGPRLLKGIAALSEALMCRDRAGSDWRAEDE